MIKIFVLSIFEWPLKTDFTVIVHAIDTFCRRLTTIANSLDPDQAQRNVRPFLDYNCDTRLVFPKKYMYFEIVDFESKTIFKKSLQASKSIVFTQFHACTVLICYSVKVKVLYIK